MSTNIETNVLKQFILSKLNNTNIDKNSAINKDINHDDFQEADVDENGELDIDEILEDDNLVAKFATMYQDEQKKVEAEKDKEKEKEEQTQVKDKNDTGV